MKLRKIAILTLGLAAFGCQKDGAEGAKDKAAATAKAGADKAKAAADKAKAGAAKAGEMAKKAGMEGAAGAAAKAGAAADKVGAAATKAGEAAVAAGAKAGEAAGAATAAVAAAITPEVETTFKNRCSTCHGMTGQGDGPAAAALNPKPRKYSDPAWQKSVTDDYLAKVIVEGGAAVGKSPLMAANPDLKAKPEIVKGLVAKIRSFNK